MRSVAFWLAAGACGAVGAYAAYLVLANAAAEARLSLYPWPGGDAPAVWVVLAAMAAGGLLVPAAMWLVRTWRRRREQQRAAETRKQVQTPGG